MPILKNLRVGILMNWARTEYEYLRVSGVVNFQFILRDFDYSTLNYVRLFVFNIILKMFGTLDPSVMNQISKKMQMNLLQMNRHRPLYFLRKVISALFIVPKFDIHVFDYHCITFRNWGCHFYFL